MKNDWANDHKAVLAADSLKSYVLQLHTIKSLRSALAEDNFMATERGDTLEDFYDAFDNEINRYVTKKDVMEVFPEMEPGSEDFEDGIKNWTTKYGGLRNNEGGQYALWECRRSASEQKTQ